MNIIAGKLFGMIGQTGQTTNCTGVRLPDCPLNSLKFGQSMLERKRKIASGV